MGVGVGVRGGVAVGVGEGVTLGLGVAVGVCVAVAVAVAVGVGVKVAVAVAVGLKVAVAVAVGVGVGDAATTLKLTVIEAPLLPVPPVELHGVAPNVRDPNTPGVHVKSKGVAESVFTMVPSLLNTTLCVVAFACAVIV